jgi:hypothetical protein
MSLDMMRSDEKYAGVSTNLMYEMNKILQAAIEDSLEHLADKLRDQTSDRELSAVDMSR